jgi:hypothetical protein
VEKLSFMNFDDNYRRNGVFNNRMQREVTSLDERSKILLKMAEQYKDNRLMNISRSILMA